MCETSLLPGRAFTSPADFNAQFTGWLAIANTRRVSTIKAAPVDIIESDRIVMLPLPQVPLYLGWRNRIRGSNEPARPGAAQRIRVPVQPQVHNVAWYAVSHA